MLTIYIASKNIHKVAEFEKLFAPLGYAVLGLPEGIPEALETGRTFTENAKAKAVHYAKFLAGCILADDSGIEVYALGGAPGIYSARYAGEHGNDDANNKKLLTELRGLPEHARSADFVCALVLILQSGVEITALAKVAGVVLEAERGENGFGYDSLFYVPELQKTFAEFTVDEKNQYSHRACASRMLMETWRESQDAVLPRQ